MKLLAPLPSWLKPGRAHVFLVMEGNAGEGVKARPQRPAATPELVARRMQALAKVREMNP